MRKPFSHCAALAVIACSRALSTGTQARSKKSELRELAKELVTRAPRWITHYKRYSKFIKDVPD